VAQNKLNPLASRQEQLQHEIDTLVGRQGGPPLSEAEHDRLDDLKDTLALLSGLEGKTPKDVANYFRRVDEVIDGKPLDPASLRPRKAKVSAERLYINQKVSDLVSKAESEQRDYRRSHRINVFFSPEKVFYLPIGREEKMLRFSVMNFNTAVLIAFSFATLGGVYLSLRRQLRTE